MKHKQLALVAVFLLGLGLTCIQAQTSLNATGGKVTSSAGTVSYTVGQVAYSIQSGTNGSVAQGIQQPYEISAVTGIKEVKGINLSVTAYPNPTTNYLQLKVENEKLKNLSYQLYNLKGKLLKTKQLRGTATQINMSHLVPSTYFVKVYDIQNNKEVKTFKIIKN